jgi:hypothetical protein
MGVVYRVNPSGAAALIARQMKVSSATELSFEPCSAGRWQQGRPC